MEPGLHFDQLMAIGDPQRAGTDAFVDIFNIDGSRAEACGNGTRCVAWAMLRHSDATNLLLQTAGGDLACTRLGETTFSVDMGEPRFGWRDIPLRDPVNDTRAVILSPLKGIPSHLSRFSAVNMGNPHAVFFVKDASAIALAEVGPLIECHTIFPERVNVSFAQIMDRNHIIMCVWERSAGATLACGSAACATLVASVRAGLSERQARISLPGGDLSIAWREVDDHVIMSGDVELEYEGMLPARLMASAA